MKQIETINNYIEQIETIRQAQRREAAFANGLREVQLRMLHYLSRCNRYSDTPSGVTEFLQLTKGTVSQSLKVLEEKGMIKRVADAKDGRKTHLHLTEKGSAILSHLALSEQLDVDLLSESSQTALQNGLEPFLSALQRKNGLRTFGICHTCDFFRREKSGHYRCGLTLEPLQVEESLLICHEHTVPDPA